MKIFSCLMLPCLLLLFPCSPLVATAQTSAPTATVWTMQDSGTTASLRGIHSVDGKIAWASGSGGTVLHTVDGGEHWIKCDVPDGKKDGAKLDFRGVQGWDANTAIVMASGPGELSRLYRTRDGCRSWELIFKNPDSPDGFFDSFWLNAIYGKGMLIGDPVKENFVVFKTEDGGNSWTKIRSNNLYVSKKNSIGAFAASNSSIGKSVRPSSDTRGPGIDAFDGFVTGGKVGSFLFNQWYAPEHLNYLRKKVPQEKLDSDWTRVPLPLSSGSDGSGAFAFALKYTKSTCEDCGFGTYWHLLVVGGDYSKPNETGGTAAWSKDGGQTWTASEKLPHGYRSTVQWSDTLNIWITAGTNGSDVSRDDGKTWTPLDDGNWNALSLPFIVGPNGRIGRLNESAIPPVNPQATSPAR